ncbi:unnamed protein product [Parajaminaea phylloscopi]
MRAPRSHAAEIDVSKECAYCSTVALGTRRTRPAQPATLSRGSGRDAQDAVPQDAVGNLCDQPVCARQQHSSFALFHSRPLPRRDSSLDSPCHLWIGPFQWMNRREMPYAD